jgi:predicted RNA-binding Zn-ribbon protein involved in translation (DUF1610 family)
MQPFATRYARKSEIFRTNLVGSVRNILMDNNNWEKYKTFNEHELREEQIREVDSMLLCNDPSKGYFYYYCTNCNKDILRHLSCNSRICSRCGKKHVDKWSEKTVRNMLNVNHSHIIFTLPSDLWLLIKDNWDCIKELSATAYKVITEAMKQESKHAVTSGMISSLHTYGKDIKYNVHFHTIVTEGGISNKTKEWISIYYFPYWLLRIKWKEYALKVIIKHVEKSIDNQILLESIYYHRYRKGFNVKRIEGKIPKKKLVWYIARYIRHPAVSDRRIVAYDGKIVIIVCEEKKRKWYVSFTVEEFIARLIQHIPKKNFKVMRYYGLYSRRKRGFVRKDKQESITKYFHSKHAINCPSCGKILEPMEYFPPTDPNGPPKIEIFGERIIDWVS